MTITETQINGDTIEYTDPRDDQPAPAPDPTRAPDPAALLDVHIAQLTEMADDAEAAAAQADQHARAWQDVAETQDRLARGYRKALDYLAARAAEDAERQRDAASGERP